MYKLGRSIPNPLTEITIILPWLQQKKMMPQVNFILNRLENSGQILFYLFINMNIVEAIFQHKWNQQSEHMNVVRFLHIKLF